MTKKAENESLLAVLNQRRRELGLSYELLSQRSGVSRPTVQRILAGGDMAASFENIVAVARCLGFEPRFDPVIDPLSQKRIQAEKKAKKLVGLVQGTSALEGQAVDRETVESMIKQTADELLGGSHRRLWSEE